MATSLNNLAQFLSLEGRYDEAAATYRQAIAIWEKTLGPEHQIVATGLANLAQVCVNRHEYADAESISLRAIAIQEKALGPSHPDLEGALKTLAQTYHIQSRYAAAEPLYRRTLAILEKSVPRLTKSWQRNGAYVVCGSMVSRRRASTTDAPELARPASASACSSGERWRFDATIAATSGP